MRPAGPRERTAFLSPLLPEGRSARGCPPAAPRAVTGLRERARAEERQRRGAATGAAPRGVLTCPCLGAAYLRRRGAARRAAAASAAARPGAAAGPRGAPPWGRGAAGRGAAARPASVSAGLPRSFLRAPPSPPPGLPGHCSGAAPRRRASALRPPPALALALGPSRPAPGRAGCPTPPSPIRRLVLIPPACTQTRSVVP